MLKIKRGAVSLVTIQSFLLITSIIAISFILSSENVRADVPAVSVVPTQTPYVPLPKQTYFALDFGDGKTTVEEICKKLTEKYTVLSTEATKDVIKCINLLLAEGGLSG